MEVNKDKQNPAPVTPVPEAPKAPEEKPEEKKAATAQPIQTPVPVAFAPQTPAPTPAPTAPVATAPVVVPEPEGEAEEEIEEEIEEVVEPVYPDYAGPRMRVTVLFSGGLGSALMMLLCVAKGCEVFPVFFNDGSDKARRDLWKAKRIIRIIRKMFHDFVHRLDMVDIKLRKNAMRRKEYVNAALKHTNGDGINAIALGLFAPDEEDESSEEGSSEEKPTEDNNISFLQEMTNVQIVGFENFGLKELGQVLTELSESDMKKVAFMASSCLEPKGKRECGSCENCIVRHRAFHKLWGEDRTKYVKGSKVYKKMKKEAATAEVAPEGVAVPEPTPVPAEAPAPTPTASEEELSLEAVNKALKKLKRKFKKDEIDKKKYKKMKRDLLEVKAKLEEAEEKEESEEVPSSSEEDESSSDED